MEVSNEGFLVDANDWSRDYAIQIAQEHGIELTVDHWLVIEAVRGFYFKTSVSPSMRPLVNVVKEKNEKIANSLTLIRLFSSDVTRMVAMLSGLPKPSDCI